MLPLLYFSPALVFFLETLNFQMMVCRYAQANMRVIESGIEREGVRERKRERERREGEIQRARGTAREKEIEIFRWKKIIWQRRGVFYFILFIASRVSGRGFCAFRSTQSIFCGILAAPLCLGLGLDTFFSILRPGGRISVWDTCQNVIWRRKRSLFFKLIPWL